MKSWHLHIVLSLVAVLLGTHRVLALEPSLDVSQYGHTSWTARDGFSVGAIFAMAQTPDGYLWLASEFGMFRFDGVNAIPWQPPGNQRLPDKPYALLVTRDGTLWIGTFGGLVSWNGSKLIQYPEIGKQFVTSLLEDHEGALWAGILGNTSSGGRLCAIRNGKAECYGEDGSFGSFVWSLGEDKSGVLWIGAYSGLWRWRPGAPKHYGMPGMRIGDLMKSDDGRLLVGVSGGGLMQPVMDKLETYPIADPSNRNQLLTPREIDSNKLLRDRDGGLWIGTRERGILHVHHGRTDVFTKSDGLSGDVSCSIFEDREGSIWFASSRGLDRFRALPVISMSTKQGLSSDFGTSVIAATDGSVWIGSHDGLSRWKSGQPTILRKGSGLPDSDVQSLYQDAGGRIWGTFKGHGLAYIKDGKFLPAPGVPSEEVYSITGDRAGNLWLSGNKGLSHLRDGRLVENLPWSALGRQQQAKVVLSDPERGGIWLSFWTDGGILYFKDGKVQASYTVADGLGKGHVPGLQLDRAGALWAATEEGGLSRIKDGHIITLSTKNGLPCDTIHWSIEDDDRSLWMYTACGLVRVSRSDLEAWIADPTLSVTPTVWDTVDGVSLTAVSPAYFNPPVAKSTDGRLWFLGIQVVDPRHLAFNRVPPPVHVVRIVADQKTYWENSGVTGTPNVRLPAGIHDLAIGYNALSFVAPEKIRFKYKLEGQDRDWKEVINKREVQYTNLLPGSYRFRVIAANNSGLWNDQGDSLEFSIAPAYYQTNWFRALCALFILGLLWAAYHLRLRHLHHEFEITLDARVDERTRIARELHDTLLQSFQGLLLRLQTVSQILRERPTEAQQQLDSTIEQAAEAITEGRDAVQGLRSSTVERNDLALAISTVGEELATDGTAERPAFSVAVEGTSRNLHPIIRDEIYKIATEAMRNAFRHAQAQRVEVEIRYDDEQFRLRIRDDGKGIDPTVLSRQGSERHYGLHGMRERATLIGGKLTVWSELGEGTELELYVPATRAYSTARRQSWLSRKFAAKA